MNSFLNEASRHLQPHVLAAVVQGSLFAALIGIVDFGLGKRIRPEMRHALWMLVILKFLLPPTLTLPTSAAYWISHWSQGRVVAPRTPTPIPMGSALPLTDRGPRVRATPSTSESPTPAPSLDAGAILGLVWIGGSVVLVGLMLRRHREIRRLVSESIEPTSILNEALAEAGREVGIRTLPVLRLTRENHSPAICDGLSPTLLLPQFLAESASASALRGILLHELVHLRRRDLWLNALQLLTQALWWWNPVVWLTNARIRALREFAVDQEVQHLHGSGDPMAYPAALVEVARQCLTRPQLALGFVGIFESGRSIERRVRQLIENPVPTRTRLGAFGWAVLCGVSLVAIPMGFARPSTGNSALNSETVELEAISPTKFRLNHEEVSLKELQLRLEKVVRTDPSTKVHITGDLGTGEALDAVQRAGLDLFHGPRPNPLIVELEVLKPGEFRLIHEQVLLKELQSRLAELVRTNSTAVVHITGDFPPDEAIEAATKARVGISLGSRMPLRMRLGTIALTGFEVDSVPLPKAIDQFLAACEAANPDLALFNSHFLKGDANSKPLQESKVRWKQPASPMTALEVLNQIVVHADPPAECILLSEDVLFTPRTSDTTIHTRRFALKAHTVEQLMSLAGVLPTATPEEFNAGLRSFIGKLGVMNFGMPPDASDSRAVFYRWTDQSLFARGTTRELDLLESILSLSLARNPQIVLSATILDADAETLEWVRAAQSAASREGVLTSFIQRVDTSRGLTNTIPGSTWTCQYTLNAKDAAPLANKIQQRWAQAIPTRVLTHFNRRASVSAEAKDGSVAGSIRGGFVASSLPGKGRFRLKTDWTETLPAAKNESVSLHLNADFEIQDGQTAVIAGHTYETSDGKPSPRKFILLLTPTWVDEVGRPLSGQ